MNKKQAFLLELMQKETQRILNSHPRLLDIQAWVMMRAKQTQLHNETAKRALYWYLMTILAHADITSGYISVDIHDLALNLASTSAHDFSPNYALNIIRAPLGNPEYQRALAKGNSHYHPYLSPAKSTALSLFIRPHEGIQYIDKLDQALYISRAISLDQAYKKNKELDIAKINQEQLHRGSNFFSPDFYTITFLIIVKIILHMKSHRRSKINLNKLQDLLSTLNKEVNLSPRPKITIPSRNASDIEWKNFNDKAVRFAEKILGLNIHAPWTPKEYNAVQNYFEANKTLKEYMLEAKYKGEFFQERILNSPKEAEILKENNAAN